MKQPDDHILYSFRYVLGRKTYAVSSYCDWLCEIWGDVPERYKNLIEKELSEAFERDDIDRVGSGYPLGSDIDRQQWEKVRRLYA